MKSHGGSLKAYYQVKDPSQRIYSVWIQAYDIVDWNNHTLQAMGMKMLAKDSTVERGRVFKAYLGMLNSVWHDHGGQRACLPGGNSQEMYELQVFVPWLTNLVPGALNNLCALLNRNNWLTCFLISSLLFIVQFGKYIPIVPELQAGELCLRLVLGTS